MSETENVIHSYLRRIDKEMTCDKKKKQVFLHRLQNDIENFAEDTETVLTESALEKHFGTPQSIAESFLETEPYGEVKKTFYNTKFIRICVIVVCAVIALSAIGYIIYDCRKKDDFENGYIVTRTYKYDTVEGTPPPAPEGAKVYNDETEGVS